MGDSRFAGKVAIVTGGASGIGAATAERLASEGARVVIADIKQPSALDASTQFETCDVTQEAAVSRMVDAVMTQYGRIDLLVNNAGMGMLAQTPDTNPEEWRRVFALNVDSIFLVCRAAIPHIRRNGGAIVNVASISGLLGDYGFTAYSASKGAVINYTRSLALDHAADAIRVNAVCPGFIALTGLTNAIEANPGDRAEWTAAIPLQRAGTSTEIANVITFLLSDEASYMTGAIIVADGGITAHTGQPNVVRQQSRRRNS
jgi:meso-butanediol dehydrogenase / (S,S)-butanediol dehydrogenase / diacetyl reductase